MISNITRLFTNSRTNMFQSQSLFVRQISSGFNKTLNKDFFKNTETRKYTNFNVSQDVPFYSVKNTKPLDLFCICKPKALKGSKKYISDELIPGSNSIILYYDNSFDTKNSIIEFETFMDTTNYGIRMRTQKTNYNEFFEISYKKTDNCGLYYSIYDNKGGLIEKINHDAALPNDINLFDTIDSSFNFNILNTYDSVIYNKYLFNEFLTVKDSVSFVNINSIELSQLDDIDLLSNKSGYIKQFVISVNTSDKTLLIYFWNKGIEKHYDNVLNFSTYSYHNNKLDILISN
jgi:hypothetical protein